MTPFICPTLPFPDPGSEIHDRPDECDYGIFHHTLEDRRKALLSTNWQHRLNYETRALSRDGLVDTSYNSVRASTSIKQRYGVLPTGIPNDIIALIDETRLLLGEIDEWERRAVGELWARGGHNWARRILQYKRRQFAMVRGQQGPVDFRFAQHQRFDTDRAFDEVS